MTSLSPDYELVSSAVFDDFSTSVFEGVLRSCPVDRRKNRREMVLVVSDSTFFKYVDALAARMGTQADQFLVSFGSSALNYGGIPVISHEDASEKLVELYGPPIKQEET